MIDIYDFIQAAKTHALLSRLEPRHREKLLGLAREVRFAAGEIVVREKDKSKFLYFILDGKVALEIVAQERMLPVQTLHAGDAMGWSALLDGAATGDFQIRCLEPARTLAYEGPQLRAACESDFAFGHDITRLVLGLMASNIQAAKIGLAELAHG